MFEHSESTSDFVILFAVSICTAICVFLAGVLYVNPELTFLLPLMIVPIFIWAVLSFYRSSKVLIRSKEAKGYKEPKALLFLAALISPKQQREATIGDYKQRYLKDCRKFDPFRAKIIMIRDLLEALGPSFHYFCSCILKGVLKIFGLSYMWRAFFG
jgi:hypothetical protein